LSDVLRTDLRPFLEPATAVVLGASPRSGVAGQFVRNLVQGGARVTGTHPANRELGGVAVVPEIGDVDHVPDIACVALGAGNAVAGVEAALAHGTRHFVVPGLGPETGPEGAAARARLTELCLAHDGYLVGPNCMGVMAPGAPSAWIGSVLPSVRPGAVGILVQSGSFGEAVGGMGPRVGVRGMVSSGNEGAGDAADWLAFYAADPKTHTIGLMLEAIRRPAAFEQALRLAAEAGKPVVVVKVGTSAVGAERALAHSGAIAGSDAAFSALCRAYGVVRCDDYGDWIEALEVFGTGRRPCGPRLVVITNSGGEGEHAADLAERAGIPLQPLPPDLAERLDADWDFHGVANPIDYYAVAEQDEILPVVARAAAEHRAIDGVLLNIDQSLRFERYEHDTSVLVADLAATLARETGNFVAILSTATADAPDHVLRTCAAEGVPVLKGHGPGLRAVAAAVAWAPTVPEVREGTPAPAANGATRPLAEYDSRRLLGLAGPSEERAATPDEAVAAAERIGFPVVVKSDGPAHKERVGGVVLGLRDADGVRAAAARLGPVIVCEELRGGVEVLCGLVRDAAVGPMVVCGVGGSWAEPMRETARTMLAPLSQAEAEALVRDVAPVARRLDDAGVTAVARTLVALGDAAADDPRITEIDVNPLRVQGGDAVALDALVVVEEDP
jgi:acetyltransferase